MRLVKHEGKKRNIKEVRLVFDPLTIWVSPMANVVIERGDTVKEVADAIEEYFPLPKEERYSLVAYWFAMGERLARDASGPWTARETRASPGRKYLKDR